MIGQPLAVRRLIALVLGVAIAAGAGFVEFISSSAPLGGGQLFLTFTPGIIYGVVIGLYFICIQPQRKSSMLGTFSTWILGSFLSYEAGVACAIMIASSMPNFSYAIWNNNVQEMQSGVSMGILFGGLVGSFVLAMFFSFFVKRLDSLSIAFLCLVGFLCTYIGVHYSRGSEYPLLFPVWQAVVTAILLWHLLEFKLPFEFSLSVRRSLAFLVLIITGSILWLTWLKG